MRANTASAKNSDTVYLIDASIYIFQAYFSPYTECFDRNNHDLSAVYGFMRFLMQFINRVKPTHLAVARDESLFCGFRHQLCSDYKSNRELPDDNLRSQLDGCALACDAMGLAHFASRTYEADDILGTLATRLTKNTPSQAVCIVSKDKDLAQLLIDEQSYLWDYNNNLKRDRKDIISEYGVRPEQFPDYLGLTGDSVDVISGVPGVGPVKARALLAEFENMDVIYENLTAVASLNLRGAKKLPSILADNVAKAQLSKRLATIDCHVTDPNESFGVAGYEDIRLAAPSYASFADLLSDLKFQDLERDSLLAQFERLFQSVT